PRDGLGGYFADLSRALATQQATVEIDGPDLGAQAQAEGLVLSGISYDDRDDILVVASLRELRASRLSISSQARSESGWSPPTASCPRPIEVEDAEGQRTLVRLGPATGTTGGVEAAPVTRTSSAPGSPEATRPRRARQLAAAL